VKNIILLGILLYTINSFSQSHSQYDNVLLSKPADYKKAEPIVILAADYVYTSPISKDDVNRTNAISFIRKWMQGTPDYSFPFDETISKIAKTDGEMVPLYMTCLVRYAIQKGKGTDREEIKYNAYIQLAEFCENPANSYKARGEVKKMIDAKNQGKLKEYLEIKK